MYVVLSTADIFYQQILVGSLLVCALSSFWLNGIYNLALFTFLSIDATIGNTSTSITKHIALLMGSVSMDVL